jgi:parallel beta-helix repeat protein
MEIVMRRFLPLTVLLTIVFLGAFQNPPQYTDSNVRMFGAVGDGIADDTAAFTQALAVSKNVYVPAGIYKINEIQLDSARLFGTGTIRKMSEPACAIRMLGNGSKVIGLTFDSMGAHGQPNSEITIGEGATDCVIQDCSFITSLYLYSAISGAVDTAVGGTPYTTPARGLRIQNCTFSGLYSRPIYLHSVGNISITDNTIRDCVYDAIRLRENCGYAIISNNQFYNIGNPNWPDHETRDALDTFWAGDNLTVTGNIIDNVAYHGLDLKLVSPSGLNGSRRIIVSNNQISKCRRSGIILRGSTNFDGAGSWGYNDHVIVQSNIFQDNNQDNKVGTGDPTVAAVQADALLRYLSIKDNNVFGTYGRGIVVSNAFANVPASYGVQVSGNFAVNNGCPVRKTGEAIRISGIGECQILGNQAHNDPALPNAGSQTKGIVYFSSSSANTSPRNGSVLIKNNISKNHSAGNLITGPGATVPAAIAVMQDNVTQ